MSFYESNYPADQWSNAPAANPDQPNHLDKIRNEVANVPPERPNFYGLDAGIFKLGFTSDGAFNPGIDLGIVHGQAKVGLVNGAEAGVRLGPIVDADVQGYTGFDSNGVFAETGAQGQALTVFGAGGDVHTRFGNATGAVVRGGAHLGDIGAGAGAGASLGQDGFDAAANGGAGIGRGLRARAGGDLALGEDSQVAGGVAGNIGDVRGRMGAGVWTDGDQTVRPDLYASGAAGYNRGTLDANPPYTPYQPGQVYQQNPDLTRRDLPNPNYNGGPGAGAAGRGTIEVQPLPPVYEAATPENIARVDREIRTELCNRDKVTVHKGDTYEKIAARLMPGASSDQLAAEAQKLQESHESNGYHSLKAGQQIATEDPYTIDRQVRQLVAKHFGWPAPQD